MLSWIVIIFIIVAVAIIAFFIVGNYFYDTAISSSTKKNFDTPSLDSEIGFYEDAAAKRERKLADVKFRSNIQKAILDIQSNDGLKLKAYKYQPPSEDTLNHKWAVVVHGYASSAKDMLTYIRRFYEMGFNVLAPDLRGHGESEGTYIGMGWKDRLDILMWVDLIIKEDPEAEIVLFGLSMGAATVLMASGEELPPNIKAVIEDCGYTSTPEVLAHQLKRLFGLREFPFLLAASAITRLRAGYSLYSGSAVKSVATSKTPTLFIHGDQDTFVPFFMLEPLYEACSAEKEKLVVKNARHAESVLMAPREYWDAINTFCDKYVI